MFKTFTKKQFEYLLLQIVKEMGLGFMKEVEEFTETTWEHVYEISTKNRAVKIIIFSSVDKRTGKTRNNGTDRVRVILKWVTKNGPIYKRIARHNRIDTLFDNMEETLTKCSNQVFKLKYKEFKPYSNNKQVANK